MNLPATGSGVPLPQRRQLVNVFLICLLAVVSSVMYILMTERAWSAVEFHVQPPLPPERLGIPLLPPHCGGVLKAVAQGHWVKKNMSAADNGVMVDFFRKALSQYHVPHSLEREDGQCNNVTYVWNGRKETQTVTWFKAICNPTGSRPCCRDNHCVNETAEECRCLDCLDFRNQVNAEYATWVAKDASCQYRNFSYAEACAVARGATLVFVGDSFIRHVYTAALQLLSGNPHDVALRPGTSKAVHDTCTGMMMYTEKLCRLHLTGDTKLCNGSVDIRLRYLWSATFGPQFLKLVKSLANTPNSFVFAGVGAHNQNNATLVFQSFTKPVVDFLNTSSTGWPKLVWMGMHAQGMFKTPNAAALNQHNAGVAQYVRDCAARLAPYGTALFDSYNMTLGVASFDGSHFGLGVNFLKMQVLLNYVMEVTSGVS